MLLPEASGPSFGQTRAIRTQSDVPLPTKSCATEWATSIHIGSIFMTVLELGSILQKCLRPELDNNIESPFACPTLVQLLIRVIEKDGMF